MWKESADTRQLLFPADHTIAAPHHCSSLPTSPKISQADTQVFSGQTKKIFYGDIHMIRIVGLIPKSHIHRNGYLSLNGPHFTPWTNSSNSYLSSPSEPQLVQAAGWGGTWHSMDWSCLNVALCVSVLAQFEWGRNIVQVIVLTREILERMENTNDCFHDILKGLRNQPLHYHY